MATNGPTTPAATGTETTASESAALPASGGHQGIPTGYAPETMNLRLYNLRFDMLRSALYHSAREHWFTFWHRTAIAAGLLAGAAAITATLNDAPKDIVLAVGVVVTIFAILDLVFDWNGAATTHARLRERFFGLLSDLEQCEQPELEIKRLNARLAETYQEEMPVYHALNELMWNRAYEALSANFDSKHCRKVTGLRRFFAQIFPQRGHDFSPHSERRSATLPITAEIH